MTADTFVHFAFVGGVILFLGGCAAGFGLALIFTSIMGGKNGKP
tara:strand:+ start:10738 stop:10869 length:132 start_codon:yes stop_codon:yes gene_type:complete